MSHESQYPLKNEIDAPSINAVYVILIVTAILIAVSIEALLLMFKSVLGSSEYLVNSVAMMATSVGLLVGLGIYVYLGAKAEALLKSNTTSHLK